MPYARTPLSLNSPGIGHGIGPANFVHGAELATSKGMPATQKTLSMVRNSPGRGLAMAK